MPYVSALDVLKVKGDERFRVYHWFNAHRVKAILWNHRHELFQDATVRRALTLAVNRRRLHTALNLPPELPTFDGPFTPRQFWSGEVPEGLPSDTDRARELLEAIGWRDLDRDGILERNGEEFRYTLLVAAGGGSWEAQSGRSAAVFIQAELRALGIAMEIQQMDGMAVRTRLRNGDFDAVLTDVTYNSKHEVFGANSPIGYGDLEVIDLLQRIETALHPDTLDALHAELAAIVRRDQAVLFLYPSVATTLAHRRIRGLSTPHRGDPVWYLEDLWIEE